MLYLPTIAILEDTDERIRTLQRVFGGAIEIVESKTVSGFLQKTEAIKTFDFIILDHDLNNHKWNDINGQNGLDAAKALNVSRKIPILIWSWNAPRANEMKRVLIKRGYQSVVCIPYAEDVMPKIVNLIFKSLMSAGPAKKEKFYF